jgi:hypothetical protein
MLANFMGVGLQVTWPFHPVLLRSLFDWPTRQYKLLGSWVGRVAHTLVIQPNTIHSTVDRVWLNSKSVCDPTYLVTYRHVLLPVILYLRPYPIPIQRTPTLIDVGETNPDSSDAFVLVPDPFYLKVLIRLLPA